MVFHFENLWFLFLETYGLSIQKPMVFAYAYRKKNEIRIMEMSGV